MDSLIHIGSKPTKETFDALADSIIRILEARADQKTIRHALNVLTQHARTSNVALQNVRVYGGDKPKADPIRVETQDESGLGDEA